MCFGFIEIKVWPADGSSALPSVHVHRQNQTPEGPRVLDSTPLRAWGGPPRRDMVPGPGFASCWVMVRVPEMEHGVRNLQL